jgi:hypothetical protein
MLTLEQVRAVNDGFKNGDFAAAFQPLEEQIDLRHAELPRLDKAAVAALKTGLQTTENAQFWAEAAFHPNISVRRFARKTLLGLRGDAAPVAAPLQARLERFWAEEVPLPWSNNAREAAARREQVETVQSAIEILLRADPDAFMTFWTRLIEAAQPAKRRQQSESEGWRKRQDAYSRAYQKQVDALLVKDWGAEYASGPKRMQLPARVWREINEQAQNDPHVKALHNELGEGPWAVAAQQWQPPALFNTALGQYLKPDATAPQREVADKVRVQLWHWIEAALGNGPSGERAVALMALSDVPGYLLGQWLGHENIWQRLPALLQNSRPSLLKSLVSALQDRTGAHREPSYLWAQLAGALAQSCRKPYYIKSEDWGVPEDITPEVLRDLKIKGENWGINRSLEDAAKELEKSHRTQAKTASPAKTPTEPEDKVEPPHIPLHFSSEDWTETSQEAQRSGEDWNSIYKRRQNEVRQQIEAVEDVEQKIERLLEPTPLESKTRISRLSYWTVWVSKLGRDALMKPLWPRVGPLLWARYEAQLEAYRRVESDEIAPQIGAKLSPRELKEWKTAQRRLKKQGIANEIRDLAWVLADAEGFEGQHKMLRLLERPGVKDLLLAQQKMVLAQITQTVFNRDQKTREQSSDPEWLHQNWFLDQKWGPFIAQAEAQLLGNKRASTWDRQSAARQLAIAHYRLNTPESRARFRELAIEARSLGHELVLPVTTLGDVETWLLFVATLDYPIPELKKLWTQSEKSENGPKLTAQLFDTLATLSNERAAKFVIEMLGELSPDALAPHASTIFSLLESPLVPVKRWAMAKLPLLPEADWDAENAARLAGEMLWSENGALAKDAAKFLGVVGAKNEAAAREAWEQLCGAASLANLPLLEAIFRALTQIRARNREFSLDESAQMRLEELVAAQSERFSKFSKKLV